MPTKNFFHQEWTQFTNYLRFNWPKLCLLVGIDVFFIYRYLLIREPDIQGDIVTFLQINGQHTLTEAMILNITSILFYCLPLIYNGKEWTTFMKTTNPFIKVRQHFSYHHFLYGQFFWLAWGISWYLLNMVIDHFLNIPFSTISGFCYFVVLFSVLSNILLLCATKDAYLIGWIIIILFLFISVIQRISFLLLIIILLIILVMNYKILQNDDLL